MCVACFDPFDVWSSRVLEMHVGASNGHRSASPIACGVFVDAYRWRCAYVHMCVHDIIYLFIYLLYIYVCMCMCMCMCVFACAGRCVHVCACIYI